MSHSPAGGSGPGASRAADLVAGAVVAAVAIAAIVASLDFPSGNLDSDVGPARFPLIYAVALLILSAILVLGRLRSGKDEQPASAATAPQAPFRFKPVAIGVAATALYIYLITPLGYPLPTVVFLVGMMRLMGQRHWVKAPLIAVAVTAALYFVFLYGLQIPLPVGTVFEDAGLL